MKHEVKVVEIGDVQIHPNADSLGVTIIDGYTVIVRTIEWHTGMRGVYVGPDYVVPEAPWTAFLGEKRRIRVKKLRGIYSQGLLVPIAAAGLDESTPAGTDVMEALGITRYEPPVEFSAGSNDEAPPEWLSFVPTYDLEDWRKYRALVPADVRVVVTEKLHGENARYAFGDGRMYLGSRTRWKDPGAATSWSLALQSDPWIEAWCRANPGLVLYGEVIGGQAKMKYGVGRGRAFRAFDVLRGNAWLGFDEFAALVPAGHRAPVLADGLHGELDIAALAEGRSLLGPHVREGCVVKPAVERTDPSVGRVALKCVGNGYFELDA